MKSPKKAPIQVLFIYALADRHNYARCTFPDLSARVLTYTRFGLPSTKMRTSVCLHPKSVSICYLHEKHCYL